MRGEEKFTDKKSLNIPSLQTDYLNLDRSSSGYSRHNERAHSVKEKCTFCGGNNHSAEMFSKESDRKMKNLTWLMIHLTEIRNFRLGNAIDVDLNIT